MKQQCIRCKKMMKLDEFGIKKDNKYYSKCITCRDHVKKYYNDKYVRKRVVKTLLDEFPALKEEWDEEKNGSMSNYFPKSTKKVWWICKKNTHHKWDAIIINRTNKHYKCPYCSNHRICECGCNSLYNSNPELREEWDEEKNGSMKKYSFGSQKKVWWNCSLISCHSWNSSIKSRTNGRRCPYCSNRRICECGCTSLYNSNPELREEWDEEKNGSMKKYAPQSNKKVWWICKKDVHHKWQTTSNNRVSGNGCPLCANQIICSCGCNSLYYTSDSKLKAEWDEEKNGSMKKFSPVSGKKVWWKCIKNSKHVWKTCISYRTYRGDGCPYCKYRSESVCREILTNIMGVEFHKSRPKFLNGQELDGYNDGLKLAFEYNGKQHYELVSYFHRNGIADLLMQKKRDAQKMKLCNERGITVIVIPWEYNYYDIIKLREFITQELIRYDYLLFIKQS